MSERAGEREPDRVRQPVNGHHPRDADPSRTRQLARAIDYLRRRGAPADPSVLVDHDVVVYSGPHPASQWCAHAFRGATVALCAASMQVTAAAAAAGVGLAVIPTRAARLFAQLQPVSPAVAHGTGWIVVHPDLRRVPRVRVVIDSLATQFRESSARAHRSSP